MVILIILVVLIALFIIFSPFLLVPQFGSLCVVTGGLKAGKSTFSLHLAYKTWKRNKFIVALKNIPRRIFKKKLLEKPLFYSTIPVSFPHVRITKELILRQHRFAYKSVVWIDETTLLADSSLYKDTVQNAQLLEFCKLFGHETRGGTMFFTSHCIEELHHSMRRVSNQYYYVHRTIKWIPFLCVCAVREERYSEDGHVTNTYDETVSEKLRWVIIPKSIWKKFDCYCYSIMTDNLYMDGNQTKAKFLKCGNIVSFNPLHEFNIKEIPNEKKDD